MKNIKICLFFALTFLIGCSVYASCIETPLALEYRGKLREILDSSNSCENRKSQFNAFIDEVATTSDLVNIETAMRAVDYFERLYSNSVRYYADKPSCKDFVEEMRTNLKLVEEKSGLYAARDRIQEPAKKEKIFALLKQGHELYRAIPENDRTELTCQFLKKLTPVVTTPENYTSSELTTIGQDLGETIMLISDCGLNTSCLHEAMFDKRASRRIIDEQKKN